MRLVDPADPTPYWLLSTRHPEALAGEIAAAIADAPDAPGASGAHLARDGPDLHRFPPRAWGRMGPPAAHRSPGS